MSKKHGNSTGCGRRTTLTRRSTLQAGLAAAVLPLAGLTSRVAHAQARPVTKVLDFMTNADVAKAEQEGQLVFYCHENEAGTAGIMEGFRKDFPEDQDQLCAGADRRALQQDPVRALGRPFRCRRHPAVRLRPRPSISRRRAATSITSRRKHRPTRTTTSATPHGYFFWTGVDPAGIAYNNDKIAAADAPKNWKDLLNPAWKGKISCKISASGLQFVQWYCLRKLYGDGFWKEFAKLQPHAFDSRVQLFDRLAKGDDMLTAIGEYPAYILFKSKGAKVAFVAPPDGLVATPLVVGAVSKAPHPEAAKLFVDWAMSKRGQAWYQTNPNLYYGSVRTDAPPMPTGVKLSDFKLLYPENWDEYAKERDTFSKEWNGMLGL